MDKVRKRCTVCGIAEAQDGMICDKCKAIIRGEALDKRKEIRKDAEREFRKEGVDPKSR
ncbi:MAG: hypothetical protein M1550_05130 [Deltaproteobacteria bacterium]|nr:hypothetical protein [Deltaproteobacteria bacterium]